jgi:hypothetical protein
MTEIESICKISIRLIAPSTSSLVADRSGKESRPCAASNMVRAASRENSKLPTSNVDLPPQLYAVSSDSTRANVTLILRDEHRVHRTKPRDS